LFLTALFLLALFPLQVKTALLLPAGGLLSGFAGGVLPLLVNPLLLLDDVIWRWVRRSERSVGGQDDPEHDRDTYGFHHRMKPLHFSGAASARATAKIDPCLFG